MTESPKHGTSGEQPDVTASGATGAGGDAAGTPPRGGSAHGERHHTYYEGGPGASSEPGGEDEFDHTASESGEPSEAEGVVLAEEDTMAATLLADLQRLQAEYVNYKKRVDRDREVIRHTAVGSVVESLLPVLDDIHMARQAGDLADGPFASIADKLEATLGRFGVERVGEAGQEFDPNVHEALMHVEAELPEGATGTTVVQVLQPGYRIGDRLVRAARVSVADPA
ncbi:MULTISPECIES: nucleotide exchange factor GrpE [unclassified Terrabacter]|uniref:nucleotide exchange factor GrpE n=1 Tax=unclassified Terrabacter TaxID=2630222 RepID=UPI0006FF01D5|nr:MULTISPECIES: nucleotide exchange factor GrpE [unclassified Terrabacter]KRB47444.1 molecular chaperone GrpE [Terrabacter sp. Root181]KRF35651.1 molecular chaperone GrpE [Terrabacter sp. Soil810]